MNQSILFAVLAALLFGASTPFAKLLVNEASPIVLGGMLYLGSGLGLGLARLIRDRGVTAAQAARDLGVHENVLRKWVRDFEADPKQAFPGQGQMKPEQLEIERLRREVTKLKAERDILKKATAYFAKDQI